MSSYGRKKRGARKKRPARPTKPAAVVYDAERKKPKKPKNKALKTEKISKKQKSSTQSGGVLARKRTPIKPKPKPKLKRKVVKRKKSATKKATSKLARKHTSSRAKRPAAKKPAAKKPGTKKPAAKKPAAKKSGTKKPGTKKPALKKTAVKRPAPKKPAAKKATKKRRKFLAARSRINRVKKKLEKLRLLSEAGRLKNSTVTKAEIKEARKKLAGLEAATGAKLSEPTTQDLRQMFWKLFKEAKATSKVPRVDYSIKKIDSQIFIGRKTMVKIGLIVCEENIEQIMYLVTRRARSMPLSGKYRNWAIVTITTAMGDHVRGSGGRVVELKDPLAFKFQTQMFENTGVKPNLPAALLALRSLLEEWSDDESSSVVYMQAIRVDHFSAKRYSS